MSTWTASHTQSVEPQLVRDDVTPALLEGSLAHGTVAIDSETTGLDWRSASLELVQVHVPGVRTELVRLTPNSASHNLVGLLGDTRVEKVFHHAAFDMGFFMARWGFTPSNVACTKVAAKLLWPGQRERQSLRALVQDHLGVTLDKTEQTSDWSRPTLTRSQLNYAAEDVRYLVPLLNGLVALLEQDHLLDLAQRCWAHLGTRVELDSKGIPDPFVY